MVMNTMHYHSRAVTIFLISDVYWTKKDGPEALILTLLIGADSHRTVHFLHLRYMTPFFE